MKTYGVPDDVAVQLITSKMPSRYFASKRYQRKAEEVTTWNDGKSAFRRRCHLDKLVGAAQKMSARVPRQCESRMDYAIQKLELIDECGSSGGEQGKCDVIFASVPSQVNRSYFDRPFTSLDQLLNTFLLYDGQPLSSKRQRKIHKLLRQLLSMDQWKGLEPAPHTGSRCVRPPRCPNLTLLLPANRSVSTNLARLLLV